MTERHQTMFDHQVSVVKEQAIDIAFRVLDFVAFVRTRSYSGQHHLRDSIHVLCEDLKDMLELLDDIM